MSSNYPPGVSDRDIDEHFSPTFICGRCGCFYDYDDEGTAALCGRCEEVDKQEKECSDMELPKTILTKSQVLTFGPKHYTEHGRNYTITVTVRHDDYCGNGHNTFSITGETKDSGMFAGGGCIHDEIRKHFPELAGLIKWHLCSTDGPLHYIANTIYHAAQHNLEFARSSAIWPEATDAELCQEPEALKAALLARLPELMARFRVAVESLGLEY